MVPALYQDCPGCRNPSESNLRMKKKLKKLHLTQYKRWGMSRAQDQCTGCATGHSLVCPAVPEVPDDDAMLCSNKLWAMFLPPPDKGLKLLPKRSGTGKGEKWRGKRGEPSRM